MRNLAKLPSLAILVLFTALVASGSRSVLAQGFLLSPNESSRLPRPYGWPHPPRPVPPGQTTLPAQTYSIKQLNIDVNLTDQVAKVQVTETFANTGSAAIEVAFVFPLPYDGAIDRMTFMIDGKEQEAKLLDAQEARKIYEGYVRKNRDPALLEWIGHGMFRTSVFPVPAGAERTVTLRYSQLCRKSNGVTELLYPLSTAKFTSQPVEKLTFRMAVQSQQDIRSIYSPTHSIEVKRPSDRQAIVTYSREKEVPVDDFRLFYDVGRGPLAASVLTYRPNASEDGYFVLFASPELGNKESIAKKNIVFVVDKSGSMNGKKIEQARAALKFVLNNLHEGDRFNIIAYDGVVESFRPGLQSFDSETRNLALGYVEGIFPGGSTNIHDALTMALNQLGARESSEPGDSRPNFVMFLTDGLPTAGETNPMKIADAARRNNKAQARIFTFGVGYDVNSRLLDKLSAYGSGQSEYVRPNEDIESSVSKIYSRIGSPVMTDMQLSFDMEEFPADKGTLTNRIFPRGIRDLFAGEQLIVVGRYKKGGHAKIRVKGNLAGATQSFDYQAEFAEKTNDDTYAFIEKLWAQRRVGELIDEIDLNGSNRELVDELVQLATKHGLITPYTSFLADENVKLNELASSRARVLTDLEPLSKDSGVDAFEFRRSKQLFTDRNAAPAASRFGISSGGAVGGGPAGPNSAKGLSARPAGPAADEAARREVDAKEPAVINLGRTTFYRRGPKWIDSVTTPDEITKAKRIEKFSDDYFALLDKHGKEYGKALALDGTIVISINGVTYEIFEN